ncbi:acyl-CoA dehydrogenase family protein [Dactylosporangium sp. CA-233914]|uniref:acyl-CoA dehydrogenase family protein n=1 Tax=Dactylosporangium sp. CA-233914 TaxID=3239934 RepID=UPI003D8AC2BE
MTDLGAMFDAFLDDFLPADYVEDYQRYRTDAELRKAYQAAAFDEGWLIPEWSRPEGGRDLNGADALAVKLVGARRRVPRFMNIQGVGVAAPAIRAFGTAAQRDRLLRPAARGDEWWALGMSEPGAGSDLASLRTTATLADGVFTVNGQKIWTTQGDEARWCTLYVRTATGGKPHHGISCLILDLRSPGVVVRPIRTAGPAVESFCEVFLDDVQVPEDALLGPLNGGWTVAMSSLEHERDMIWINTWLETSRALGPTLRAPHLAQHQLVKLGRALADAESVRLTGLRTAAQRFADLPSPAASILKLLGSESVQRAALLSLEVAGERAFDDPALFDERLESLGATIYGGTSEVQRNIIAERTLGLPKGGL